MDERWESQLRLFWRSLLVSVAWWTLVGVLFAINLLLYDRSIKNYLPWFHYFIWPALTVYSWALITPFVFRFCRKFPFERSHWLKRGLQYIALAVPLSYAQSSLYGLGGWLYTHEMPLRRFLLHELHKSIPATIQTWLVLFALAAYQRLRNETRMRALHEAQLEARVASAELEMLRMQLQPHFLFNTLQAVAVLVHEDANAAEEMLLRLSELLRIAFDKMSRQEVSLAEELSFLNLYLGIQKQRFGDRLTVHIDADPAVLPLPVPSLILQPLVENALHHGIGVHRERDAVEISARMREGDLELEVRNFGSDLRSPSRQNGHGVGLSNTRARLEQLYGNMVTLTLRQLEPRGVAATIRIPREALR